MIIITVSSLVIPHLQLYKCCDYVSCSCLCFQSNSNVGGKPLLSNRSIFRVCLHLSHYFSFQTGRVFLQCLLSASVMQKKKVYGFSSSIQNIIQLQGVIQLILILTYWFANQYLNSKEHVGFKIIRALNVKSELVIFRKENMMTWAAQP